MLIWGKVGATGNKKLPVRGVEGYKLKYITMTASSR